MPSQRRHRQRHGVPASVSDLGDAELDKSPGRPPTVSCLSPVATVDDATCRDKLRRLLQASIGGVDPLPPQPDDGPAHGCRAYSDGPDMPVARQTWCDPRPSSASTAGTLTVRQYAGPRHRCRVPRRRREKPEARWPTDGALHSLSNQTAAIIGIEELITQGPGRLLGGQPRAASTLLNPPAVPAESRRSGPAGGALTCGPAPAQGHRQ